MSDLEPIGSKEITNSGVRGIGATVGGLALFFLRGLSTAFGGFLGLGLGALSFIVGASSVKSASKADKVGGSIAMGAGIVLALPGAARLLHVVPVVGGILGVAAGFSGWVIGAGALALVGYGVFNIVKFVRGIRSHRG
ncbi:MAG TPA: hypothetical protein P5165_05065 [Spirochaetia bacterium]|nr:hypothetical protein [Spirochaetales bacterium]HRY72578.1 hypothetical protein [Spirochaetia bacterium]